MMISAQSIGVFSAGTMCTGIAHAGALADFSVVVMDVGEERIGLDDSTGLDASLAGVELRAHGAEVPAGVAAQEMVTTATLGREGWPRLLHL